MATLDLGGNDIDTSSVDQVASAFDVLSTNDSTQDQTASTDKLQHSEQPNFDLTTSLLWTNIRVVGREVDEEVTDTIPELEENVRRCQGAISFCTNRKRVPALKVKLAGEMALLCAARKGPAGFEAEDLAMLHQAAQMARDEVAKIEETCRNWPDAVSTKSIILNTLYEATEYSDHLDEAIRTRKMVLTCDKVTNPFHAFHREALARQLYTRWIFRTDTSNYSDLEAAEHYAREGLRYFRDINGSGNKRKIFINELTIKLALETNDIKIVDGMVRCYENRRKFSHIFAQMDHDELREEVVENRCFLVTSYCWHYGMTACRADLELIALAMSEVMGEDTFDSIEMLRCAAQLFWRREIEGHDGRFDPPPMAWKVVRMLNREVATSQPRMKL